MVKSLINKLRKGILIATAGLVFNGCQLPEPTPYSTEGPTAIVTEAPTAQPTAEPTAIPIQYETISGRLESNEEYGVLKSGEVILYIDNIPNQTDSDGNFSFSVPSGSNVKLEGAIENNGVQTSYVRTMNLGNVTQDNTSIKLRAVPYPDFDTDNNGILDNTDYQNFKNYMNDINISKDVAGDGKEYGLLKWNLNNFNKIKIFEYNNENGSFSQDQINLIKNKIKCSNDIEKFINGKIIFNDNNVNDNNVIEVQDNAPSGSESNCIYVVPNNNLNESGATTFIPFYRVTNGARIELDPKGIISGQNNTAITHEFGHAFIASNLPGHSTLLDNLTIMRANPNGALPKVADIKAGKIVYEDTYNPGERLDDILGMSW